MLHSALTKIHVLENWTYANAAARTGATGFLSTDLGKIAYQVDNGTYWRLTAVTPTWVLMAGLGPPGPAGTILRSDGSVWSASTPTFPNAPGTAGQLLRSDGTNFGLSTPAFPNTSPAVRQILIGDGTNWAVSPETYSAPGPSGYVLKSDGTNWASAQLTGLDIVAVIAKLTAVNLNIANNDNPITLPLQIGISRWRLGGVIITHPVGTVPFSTATFQLYTGAGGTGTALLGAVTSGAGLTSTAENTNGNSIVPGNAAAMVSTVFNLTTIYFRTIAAQGAAATVDVTVTFNALP